MSERRSGAARAAARLDVALVETGLFATRAKAKEAIAAGLVSVDGATSIKPATQVVAAARLEAMPPYPWVSRGGVKLAAAVERFGIVPEGCVCLDIGASTGGFTDVLLAKGARRVYAVDVGRGQLHERLRDDPRVVDLSSTDARKLTQAQIAEVPNLIVCDASFISLTLLLPAVLPMAATSATLVCLIKPQFEVGPGQTHKGIVRDEGKRHDACRTVIAAVEALGWRLLGIEPSPITGGDGNIEFLLGARRP